MGTYGSGPYGQGLYGQGKKKPPPHVEPPHPPSPKKMPYAMSVNPPNPFGDWTALDEAQGEMRPEVPGVTSGYNPR